MRKIVSFVILPLFFIGCSSEHENMEREFDEEVILSSDELLDRLAQKCSGEASSISDVGLPESRSSINQITLYGYSSLVTSKNQKIYINKELADMIGISSQIYILQDVTAYMDITVEGYGETSLFSSVTSPLCGVDPSRSWADRGYSTSSPSQDGNIRLTSICMHIISDISGKNYDIWYPAKPETFEWNYKIISL